MDNNLVHEYLKCPHCGKSDLYHFFEEVDSIACTWCKEMFDVDKGLELARKDNL